jgi:hypothetical protein
MLGNESDKSLKLSSRGGTAEQCLSVLLTLSFGRVESKFERRALRALFGQMAQFKSGVVTVWLVSLVGLALLCDLTNATTADIQFDPSKDSSHAFGEAGFNAGQRKKSPNPSTPKLMSSNPEQMRGVDKSQAQQRVDCQKGARCRSWGKVRGVEDRAEERDPMRTGSEVSYPIRKESDEHLVDPSENWRGDLQGPVVHESRGEVSRVSDKDKGVVSKHSHWQILPSFGWFYQFPSGRSEQSKTVPLVEKQVPGRRRKNQTAEVAFSTILYVGTSRDYEYFVATRVMIQTLLRTGTRADIVVLASEGVPREWVDIL